MGDVNFNTYYRGYYLEPHPDGRILIYNKGVQVGGFEENLDEARKVVDGWLNAR